MEQNTTTTIVLGSDHAGWELKEAVKEFLKTKGISVVDVSEPALDPEDDYPKYAFKVAKLVAAGKFKNGIALCGTGIGASIAANRVRGVRAALCFTPEMGRMTKVHNNANVLVLGGRTTPVEVAFQIIEAWLGATFEGGRHSRRITQLDTLE
jgi:RpiB/LacA/LacB family sugar-phosphate isomerase